MSGKPRKVPSKALEHQEEDRWQVLSQLEDWLNMPMLVLSFLWLALVITELIWSTSGVFQLVATVIWIIFILEFLLRLTLAPEKRAFLRSNVITIVALIAPAFRFLNALRFLRMARGLRLVRVIGTANRGLNALRKSFRRRGVGYVLVATTLIIFLGAAGMLAFEPAREVTGGFEGYGDALWWTAMMVATMGSAFWPETAEGRVLAFLLAVFGLGVFSYITGTLATFFIGQEARARDGEVAGSGEIADLQRELRLLRSELKSYRKQER